MLQYVSEYTILEGDYPSTVAAKFKVAPGWQFLTGKEADINLLRKKLGLYVDLVQADGSKNHNLSVILGNQATGRWMRTSPMENPYVVAAKVGDWLHNWKDPREAGDVSFIAQSGGVSEEVIWAASSSGFRTSWIFR